MKKIGILLALLLLLGCLTGCGSAAKEEPQTCTYTVTCRSEEDAPVEGVVVNFCTDTMCTPVTSGEDGNAVFSGDAEAYHVQIVKVPEGWELVGDAEWVTEAYSQTFRISFAEVGK